MSRVISLFILIFGLHLGSMRLEAQILSTDTFKVIGEGAQGSLPQDRILDHLSQTRLFQATYIGVPLIAVGIIEKQEDTKFRQLRNEFMPQFHHSIDNYTQYLPTAVLFGLKTAGVKSRSSWRRMLVSDALSMTLMTCVVQGFKHITNIPRPDGSNSHSFPSGHTATAFMTATMLTKEYGYISPWVGVGAYSIATATGLMRVANNKHWLSDVLVGAGIGVISTEVGYWIADKIFKNKGLEIGNDRSVETIDFNRNPSCLGLYMGINLPLSKFDIDDTHALRTSSGMTIGLDGVYFLNRYIGIGGRATVSNLQYILNDTQAPSNTFDFSTIAIGPYISFPLSNRWNVGGRLLVGAVHYPQMTIGDLQLGHRNELMVGSGASMDYLIHSQLFGSLFFDYNIQGPPSVQSNEYIHLFTFGAKVAIRF